MTSWWASACRREGAGSWPSIDRGGPLTFLAPFLSRAHQNARWILHACVRRVHPGGAGRPDPEAQEKPRGGPVLFLKPARGAVNRHGEEFIMPFGRDEDRLSYEVELAIVFESDGKYIVRPGRLRPRVRLPLVANGQSPTGAGGRRTGVQCGVRLVCREKGRRHTPLFAPQGPWISCRRTFYGDPMEKGCSSRPLVDGITGLQQAGPGGHDPLHPGAHRYASSLLTVFPGDVLARAVIPEGTGAMARQRATGLGTCVGWRRWRPPSRESGR